MACRIPRSLKSGLKERLAELLIPRGSQAEWRHARISNTEQKRSRVSGERMLLVLKRVRGMSREDLFSESTGGEILNEPTPAI